MYDYTNTKICELWPHVVKIEIKAKKAYRSALNVHEREEKAVYAPEFSANFLFRCMNDDCTEEYFNLYGKVSSMVAHHEEYAKGTLSCEGNEAKDHSNSCPCVLEYEINILYEQP